MIIIPLLMLLTPGLIAVRILWNNKPITRTDFPFIVSDYIIYSFLIMLSSYAVMFLSYAERTVSFSTQFLPLSSTIFGASFVVKYSVVALIAAVALPVILPKLIGIYKPHMQRMKSKKEKSAQVEDYED